MPLDAQTIGILSVLLVSTLVRSTFGFGDALIAMPILAVAIGIKTATPLVALVAMTIALAILLRSWRDVRLKSGWRLVVSSLAGIPFGLLFLKLSYEGPMKLALAAVIVGFSLYKLLNPEGLRLRTQKMSYLFGFAAGVLGAAYNTNGPPIVIYGSLRRWPPNEFRATLQGFFFITGWPILAGHWAAGLWTRPVLTLYGWSLPVVFAAIYAGSCLNKRIPAGKFDKWIYSLLIVIGACLAAQTVCSL
jgi:uncharacterized membrane protein YfcA